MIVNILFKYNINNSFIIPKTFFFSFFILKKSILIFNPSHKKKKTKKRFMTLKLKIKMSKMLANQKRLWFAADFLKFYTIIQNSVTCIPTKTYFNYYVNFYWKLNFLFFHVLQICIVILITTKVQNENKQSH